MKLIQSTISFVLIFGLLLASSSCGVSRSKVVRVTGEPGTCIYTSGKELIGRVGTNGVADIKLDAEQLFYLSKHPEKDTYIPFAVNLKNKYHAVEDSEAGAGMAMGALLCGLTFGVGLIFCWPGLRSNVPLDTSTHDDLFKSVVTTVPATIAPQKPAFQQQVAPQKQIIEISHYVVRGETMSSIAQRYNIPLDELCRLNNLTRNAMLRVGQQLRVTIEAEE